MEIYLLKTNDPSVLPRVQFLGENDVCQPEQYPADQYTDATFAALGVKVIHFAIEAEWDVEANKDTVQVYLRLSDKPADVVHINTKDKVAVTFVATVAQADSTLLHSYCNESFEALEFGTGVFNTIILEPGQVLQVSQAKLWGDQ